MPSILAILVDVSLAPVGLLQNIDAGQFSALRSRKQKMHQKREDLPDQAFVDCLKETHQDQSR